jgi:predicted transcriptional regulator
MKTDKPTTKNVYLPPTRVQESLREKLRQVAESRQTSVSALIREAIIYWFANKK